MPFTKITKGKDAGKYKSESGKIYTDKQVALYYASGGFDKTKLAKLNLKKEMSKL